METTAPFTTLPPVKLVETWLKLSHENDEHKYVKKRALDILLLIFGDIEQAQQYVNARQADQNYDHEHQMA